MAGITPGTEAVNILREIWSPEFGLDPVEEDVITPLVSEPVGATRIGNKLHLRKVKSMTTQTLNNTTLGLKSDLTYNTNTEVEVTATPTLKYAGVQYAPHTLTRIIDDDNFRAAQRKMIKAALGATRATDLLALAAAASQVINQADIDDPMLTEGIGRMSEYAMGKFVLGETRLNLVIHPREVKNYLRIPGVREYQIRGSQGSAATGEAALAYNIKCRESGLVYQSGGVAYQPLLLKDAWAIGYNIEPSTMDPELDGMALTVIGRMEYGVAEWFDSSVVVLACNV